MFTIKSLHAKNATLNWKYRPRTYFSASSREWQRSLTVLVVSQYQLLPSATWHPMTTCGTHALTGTWSWVSISPPCVENGRLAPAGQNVAATSSSRPGDLPYLTARQHPSSLLVSLHCCLHITNTAHQRINNYHSILTPAKEVRFSQASVSVCKNVWKSYEWDFDDILKQECLCASDRSISFYKWSRYFHGRCIIFHYSLPLADILQSIKQVRDKI